MDNLISQMRVYAISDQDDAGYWIRREFPNLFYIVNPSNPDGNDIDIKWWIYPEASTAKDAALSSLQGEDTDVDLSGIKQRKGAVHVILQIHDDGTPLLYAYRRVVIQL